MNKSVFSIIVSLIVVTLGVGVYLYICSDRTDPATVVQFLYQRYDIDKKVFNDLSNDIEFEGFKSTGYDQINNTNCKIKFGKMIFTLNIDDLEREDLMKMINRMGITVDVETDEETNENTFTVRYNGELVPEYDLQVGR